MRALLGAGVVLLLAFGAAAEDKKEEKIDGKKLIGKWESAGDKMPKIVVEYTADGKLTGAIKAGPMEIPVTGTYKLDGNKLTQTTKVMDKEQTRVITLTKLTDTEMAGEWEGGGKQEFQRVKK